MRIDDLRLSHRLTVEEANQVLKNFLEEELTEFAPFIKDKDIDWGHDEVSVSVTLKNDTVGTGLFRVQPDHIMFNGGFPAEDGLESRAFIKKLEEKLLKQLEKAPAPTAPPAPADPGATPATPPPPTSAPVPTPAPKPMASAPPEPEAPAVPAQPAAPAEPPATASAPAPVAQPAARPPAPAVPPAPKVIGPAPSEPAPTTIVQTTVATGTAPTPAEPGAATAPEEPAAPATPPPPAAAPAETNAPAQPAAAATAVAAAPAQPSTAPAAAAAPAAATEESVEERLRKQAGKQPGEDKKNGDTGKENSPTPTPPPSIQQKIFGTSPWPWVLLGVALIVFVILWVTRDHKPDAQATGQNNASANEIRELRKEINDLKEANKQPAPAPAPAPVANVKVSDSTNTVTGVSPTSVVFPKSGNGNINAVNSIVTGNNINLSAPPQPVCQPRKPDHRAPVLSEEEICDTRVDHYEKPPVTVNSHSVVAFSFPKGWRMKTLCGNDVDYSKVRMYYSVDNACDGKPGWIPANDLDERKHGNVHALIIENDGNSFDVYFVATRR